MKEGDSIKTVYKLRPEDIDWNRMWNEKLQEMPKKDDLKMWSQIAPKFDRWMKKDDYPHNFASKIHKEPQYTVLDLGSGNGTVTLEIASQVKQVTAVDMSKKMLGLLNKNAQRKGLSNINCVQSTIQDLPIEQVGQYDVVVASRSLAGIYDIKNMLKKLNDLTRKYVYITLWGAKANQFEKDMCKFLGIKYHQHPDYIYACNILYQLGIYANVEMLISETYPVYLDVNDALERCLWKLGWITEEIKKEDEAKLKKFLEENLVQNEDGTLDYPTNRANWVLLWWEKS